MPQQRQQLSLIATLAKLRGLCNDRRSGILHMTTPDNHQILFLLRKGAIIDVSHDGTHGLAALASVGEAKQGSLIFRDEEVKRIRDLKVLPSTQDILFLLGLPLESLNIAPLTRYDPADCAEWTIERLKANTGRMIPLSDIAEMMRYGQANQLSATLFFITTDRKWFEFVYEDGDIVDATSQEADGFAAIRAFKAAKGVKYSIRLRRCSDPTDYRSEQPLPSTIEILRFMETSAEPFSDDELRTASGASEEDSHIASALLKEHSALESLPSGKTDPNGNGPPSSIRPTQSEPSVSPPHSPAPQPSSIPREIATRPRARTSWKEQRQDVTPLTEILQHLYEVCKDRQTGAMFIVRSDRRGILEFFVDHGRIIDIVCLRRHGVEALQLAKEVGGGRYSFTEGRTPSSQRDLEDLPSNEEIFYQLGMPLETLGIAKESRGKETSAVSERHEGERKKILVVDDSPLTRKVVSKTLSEHGFAVVEAVDGETALSVIENERPDLVLLDLIMPGIDGYQVLSAVRHGSKDIKDVPVILLTSRNKLFDKFKGRMAGSDEYLTKPFKPDELLRKIRKHLA